MSDAVGVRRTGAALHVRAPGGTQRRTRCGLRLGGDVEEWAVDDVPPEERCRKCFPGSARRTAPLPDPVDNS